MITKNGSEENKNSLGEGKIALDQEKSFIEGSASKIYEMQELTWENSL